MNERNSDDAVYAALVGTHTGALAPIRPNRGTPQPQRPEPWDPFKKLREANEAAVREAAAAAAAAPAAAAPEMPLEEWRADVNLRLARLEAPVPIRGKAAAKSTTREGGTEPPRAA